MKNINIKMLMILLGILTVFTLNGCSEGDGESGAHSEINLLDDSQQDDGPVNQAPIADAQSVSVEHNTPIEITLVGSDTDGDALTYSIVTDPAHGTVTLADNIATYTPAMDYNGTDSFTFRVQDTQSAYSAPATVGITVAPADPINQAPIADAGVDKYISVAEGATITVDLNGTQSTDDGLNAPLTYSWSLVSSGSTTEPDLTDATSEIAKVGFSCSTFSEMNGDTDRCPMNDTGQWVCEYTYSLSIYDGQYSDDDNVTIRVAYDDMCRYDEP